MPAFYTGHRRMGLVDSASLLPDGVGWSTIANQLARRDPIHLYWAAHIHCNVAFAVLALGSPGSSGRELFVNTRETVIVKNQPFQIYTYK